MSWRIWLLPFVLPFGFAAAMRLLFIFMGVEPSDAARAGIALMATLLMFFAVVIVCAVGASRSVDFPRRPPRPTPPKPRGGDV